jgi:hypothetical protein
MQFILAYGIRVTSRSNFKDISKWLSGNYFIVPFLCDLGLSPHPKDICPAECVFIYERLSRAVRPFWIPFSRPSPVAQMMNEFKLTDASWYKDVMDYHSRQIRMLKEPTYRPTNYRANFINGPRLASRQAKNWIKCFLHWWDINKARKSVQPNTLIDLCSENAGFLQTYKTIESTSYPKFTKDPVTANIVLCANGAGYVKSADVSIFIPDMTSFAIIEPNKILYANDTGVYETVPFLEVHYPGKLYTICLSELCIVMLYVSKDIDIKRNFDQDINRIWVEDVGEGELPYRMTTITPHSKFLQFDKKDHSKDGTAAKPKYKLWNRI